MQLQQQKQHQQQQMALIMLRTITTVIPFTLEAGREGKPRDMSLASLRWVSGIIYNDSNNNSTAVGHDIELSYFSSVPPPPPVSPLVTVCRSSISHSPWHCFHWQFAVSLCHKTEEKSWEFVQLFTMIRLMNDARGISHGIFLNSSAFLKYPPE